MFIWHEIESIEHSARNFPTLKTEEAVPNGYICAIEDGEVVAPSANATELYVAINDLLGDDKYLEGAMIPAGARLNLYDLGAWNGREMLATKSNIAGDYAQIAVGDVLKADADGKLSKSGVATAVTFEVLDKFNVNGVPGVRVKVVKAE
jgi:hypothetical protein